MSEDLERSIIDIPKGGRGFERFSNEAMATLFEVFICTPDRSYARQCVHDAFALLDRLEGQLSRFITNSDVSRINASPVGQPVIVGLETFACLELAQGLSRLTQGAFDVTLGRWTRAVDGVGPVDFSPSPGMRALELDKEALTVSRTSPDVQLDLGGIGKGFALDQMAGVLRTWGFQRALLHGGGSTVLALDGPEGSQGWPVTMSDPRDKTKVLKKLAINHTALSGSANLDHDHIFNPRTGKIVTDRLAAWAYGADATAADALSTAFMILSEEQIRDVCAHLLPGGGLIVPQRGDAVSIGTWPDDISS